MDAVESLRRAADLIEQRAEQRDRPGGERTVPATIEAFNAIHAEAIRRNGGRLTPTMGWHFLELLKMVRASYGVYVEDDYIDKIAYAGLAAEQAANDAAPGPPAVGRCEGCGAPTAFNSPACTECLGVG